MPADEKQIIEILKAISFDPGLLILDEATASLDSRQVQRLFELMNQWKNQDKAIVFVSHRMEEIFQIADRYVVLRNGVSVGNGNIEDVTGNELVKLMIDNESVFSFIRKEHQKNENNNPINLKVKDLQTQDLKGISFDVKKGTLVGIGGLQGQGQRDLLLALFGDIPYTGEIIFQDEKVHFRHPSDAMKKGFALVPGDRAKEGLLYIRSILENLLLPSWKKYGLPLKMKKSMA